MSSDTKFPNLPQMEGWMNLALTLAQQAQADGDVPVGAIVLDDGGEVIGRGRNLRERDGDPVAHAEVVALREAAEHKGRWRLDGCTMVVTLEPCVMCAGALVNARVARLIYGARDPKAGAVHSLYAVTTDPRLNHRLDVFEGVLDEECGGILRSFFEELRMNRDM